jgi:vacuolar-type H+-ATPase subunit H
MDAEELAQQAADRVREVIAEAERRADEIVQEAEEEAVRIRTEAEGENRTRIERARRALEELSEDSASGADPPETEARPLRAAPEPKRRKARSGRKAKPEPMATAEPEPEPEPEQRAGPATEAAPEQPKTLKPGPEADEDREEGARLAAMKMALDGATKGQIVAWLNDEIPKRTREQIAAEVMERAKR